MKKISMNTKDEESSKLQYWTDQKEKLYFDIALITTIVITVKTRIQRHLF